MDRKSVGDKIHQIVEDLDFGCRECGVRSLFFTLISILCTDAPVPRPEEPGIVDPST